MIKKTYKKNIKKLRKSKKNIKRKTNITKKYKKTKQKKSTFSSKRGGGGNEGESCSYSLISESGSCNSDLRCAIVKDNSFFPHNLLFPEDNVLNDSGKVRYYQEIEAIYVLWGYKTRISKNIFYQLFSEKKANIEKSFDIRNTIEMNKKMENQETPEFKKNWHQCSWKERKCLNKDSVPLFKYIFGPSDGAQDSLQEYLALFRKASSTRAPDKTNISNYDKFIEELINSEKNIDNYLNSGEITEATALVEKTIGKNVSRIKNKRWGQADIWDIKWAPSIFTKPSEKEITNNKLQEILMKIKILKILKEGSLNIQKKFAKNESEKRHYIISELIGSGFVEIISDENIDKTSKNRLNTYNTSKKHIGVTYKGRGLEDYNQEDDKHILQILFSGDVTKFNDLINNMQYIKKYNCNMEEGDIKKFIQILLGIEYFVQDDSNALLEELKEIPNKIKKMVSDYRMTGTFDNFLKKAEVSRKDKEELLQHFLNLKNNLQIIKFERIGPDQSGKCRKQEKTAHKTVVSKPNGIFQGSYNTDTIGIFSSVNSLSKEFRNKLGGKRKIKV